MADVIVVDDHLSTSSTNPVQNKIVTAALNNKVSDGVYASENSFGTAKIWIDSSNYLNIVTEKTI